MSERMRLIEVEYNVAKDEFEEAEAALARVAARRATDRTVDD
jgi:hypothetical protein